MKVFKILIIEFIGNAIWKMYFLLKLQAQIKFSLVSENFGPAGILFDKGTETGTLELVWYLNICMSTA